MFYTWSTTAFSMLTRKIEVWTGFVRARRATGDIRHFYFVPTIPNVSGTPFFLNREV